MNNTQMEKTILQVPIEDIIPNRFQPRLSFDDASLSDLASSIKQHGIIQPLVLRRKNDKYEIIAGERRYKAAKLAGLASVPAVISNLDDNTSAEVAIVENIQRKDLTAIEEARSYQALLDKGYMTQEELARKMGLSQSAISNKLRLLTLDEAVQEAILAEKISERHARTLLKVPSHEKQKELLKDAASPLKLSWVYVNRIVLFIVVFIASILIMIYLHKLQVDYIYTEPTTDYDLMGAMDETDEQKAMETTQIDNVFLDMFRGNLKATQDDILRAMKRSKYYEGATDDTLATDSERVYRKLQTVNGEYLKWFEILIGLVFGLIGYAFPILLLIFQKKMRQMEMENEVMQFQTIILMLMRIERVNVEMILEWLERYSNIFKEPISKCVNNYEAGAWEALEQLKEDISYQDMIRIVESLQAAVEKIPIVEAFDELDTERDYYQAKRKESNDRLIAGKGLIGKGIGFAPMVCMFVGYLIVPLVFIGLTSMSSSFSTMSAM